MVRRRWCDDRVNMTNGVFDVRGRPALLITLLLVVVLLLVGCRRDRGGDDSVAATVESSVVATAAAGGSGAEATVTVPRPEAGVSQGSMRFDGREREWRVYVPSSLAGSGEAPLVLALHGAGGSGEQFAETAAFDEQAERGGFIAVYPDGTARAILPSKVWNGGRCCGYAERNDVDDVGFLTALLDELVAELPIDEERVYVTGHSNGGIMAQRLACERADRIAAIAVYAGPLEAECSPSQPVSVLNVHGDSDESIPVEGGQGSQSFAGIDFHSLEYTVSTWSVINGCHPEPVIVDAGVLLTSIWEDCAEGGALQTIVIHDASHAWAGGAAPEGPLRPQPSQALDASSVVWDFLRERVR